MCVWCSVHPPPLFTHTYTHTNSHTHKHKHTNTHRYCYSPPPPNAFDAHTWRLTCVHLGRLIAISSAWLAAVCQIQYVCKLNPRWLCDINTHANTYKQTHTQTHTHTHTHTHTQTHTHKHTHTNAHTLSLTQGASDINCTQDWWGSPCLVRASMELVAAASLCRCGDVSSAIWLYRVSWLLFVT